MTTLSALTPETTYADIKLKVEANLKEGWGIPYEWLILMARTLDEQGKALALANTRLADAQQRLPKEDARQEAQRLHKQKAAEAALRLSEYLIRHKPDMMGYLDFSGSDMELLFGVAGVSYSRYEGQ